MRKAFERRRDLIVKLAKEVPGFEVNVPEGAFYLFLNAIHSSVNLPANVKSMIQMIWPCICWKWLMWLA